MKVHLRDRQAAEKPDVQGWLRPDEEYAVLAIERLPGRVVAYRIASRQGTPALFEATLFEITDPHINEAWVVRYDDLGDLELVPETWCAPGFWEDFFDGDSAAVARYQEVLQDVTGGGSASSPSTRS